MHTHTEAHGGGHIHPGTYTRAQRERHTERKRDRLTYTEASGHLSLRTHIILLLRIWGVSLEFHVTMEIRVPS